MLYAGLDLSRKRLDFHLLDDDGRDGRGRRRAAGCRRSARPGARLARHRRADPGGDRVDERRPLRARPARARRLAGRDRRRAEGEGAGAAWPARPTGSTPGCWPSSRAATWCRRSGCPTRRVRAERERARFRLHLVAPPLQPQAARARRRCSRTARPARSPTCSASRGRELLARLGAARAVAGHVEASLRLIDELDREIGDCERELRRLGADHRYVPLLLTVPGIGWVLAYTIAAEIGDISRFPQPAQARRLHRPLPPRLPVRRARPPRPAHQTGPKYLRWALVEAATHACTHPAYRDRYQRTKPGIGKPARRQGRPGRPRPPTRRGDLAHAHPQPTLRSGRRHRPPGRLTARKEMRHRSEPPIRPCPPPRRR